MLESTGESMREMWASGAEKAIKEGDLVEATFVRDYLASTDGASFWVAESQELGVVGCVGLKRKGLHDGELVRMAVSEQSRGKRIGQMLVGALEAHCAEHDIRRVHLITANMRAASFYAKKCGFSLTHGFPYSTPSGVTLTVSKMTKFLRLEEPIRTVTIVGGTHGNERIGIELVESFFRDPAPFSRPSLKVTAVLGNPAAAAKNVRFIDLDLNRQFAAPAEAESCLEAARARELLQQLGPKSASKASATDFVIDLHSTTANVGLVTMLSAAEGCDPMGLYVASKIGARLLPESLSQSHRLTTTEGTKADSWSVDSISRSGIAIEAGPLAHGTLGARLYLQTRQMVMAALDVLEERNAGLAAGRVDLAPSAFPLQEVYTQVKTIEYPAQQGFAIHPDLEDDCQNFRLIRHGDPAFISTDGKGTVLPFVHPSAPSDGSPSAAPLSDLYTMFVNEASYRERNIAFAVYEKKLKPVLFV